MAGFIDVEWAPCQFRQVLGGKRQICGLRSRAYTVTKSIHYGTFLAFEGIRFFIRRKNDSLVAVFLNLEYNLKRFRDSMAYYLSDEQEHYIPSVAELYEMIEYYFSNKKMTGFLKKMADNGKFGYLRPYTLDEDLSIGVDFPSKPTIRMIVASFSGYLGEPFSGVVIPEIVRAVGINATGNRKLGINYPLSIRAIRFARRYDKEAKAALLLDDKWYLEDEERYITEWDSSCCMFGMVDGSIVTIPDNPLILPSITVKGLVAILKELGVDVVPKNVKYGDLLGYVDSNELAVIASVGTAGVINRCERLTLVVRGKVKRIHTVNRNADTYRIMSEIKDIYLRYYMTDDAPPKGIKREIITL